MAQRYAIRDSDQAARYLADPVLGSRLRHDVRLMTSHKGKSALELLGSPDDLKFRSCLTLFAEAASDDSDRVLFNRGAADNNKPARNVVRTVRDFNAFPVMEDRKVLGLVTKFDFLHTFAFTSSQMAPPLR
jgi:hypothetical protein